MRSMELAQQSTLTLVLIFSLGVTPGAQVSSENSTERLHQLFEEEWQQTLRDHPTWASLMGDRRYNRLWLDVSLTAIEKRQQRHLQLLHRLDEIDPSSLSPADRLNYSLFRKKQELQQEGFQYGWHLLPLTHRGGIQTANELSDSLSFDTLQDYEDWIARLEALPVYVEQTIQLMRRGIQMGMLSARIIMDRVPDQIAFQVVIDPMDSPFFKPFEQFPQDFPAEQKERLLVQARHAIEKQSVPAFQNLQEFFRNEYLPACSQEVGVWHLPRGKELYAFQARVSTTTDLTPDQIHKIGVREVRRIRSEMEKIIEQLEFEGSFQEFLHFLRTDHQFYYESAELLLEGYRALTKRIDPTLVKLFGRLPRIPYGVKPIPENIAPDTTTAYYLGPAADASRAGIFYVNLYRPEVRPKYEMEALSIHEAVPGHHLQIALAMELEELPSFRRYGHYTAFVEGWGLYAESLGEELGLYQDPYSKFGQLTYEMWRAARLVVDTGIHHLKWTRQQAIDFLKAHAAKTEHDIINEIDRYIAWPAQALAYKIGELKIKELRGIAQQELGTRFDIRAFHDRILGSGAVPMDILENNVHSWIEQVKAEDAFD